MGLHSFFGIWFTLWSQACSILKIAHFDRSQVFLVISLKEEIVPVYHKLQHSKVLFTATDSLVQRYSVWLRAKEPSQETSKHILVESRLKVRCEEKNELHMKGTEIIKALFAQASIRHNTLQNSECSLVLRVFSP